MRMRTAQLSKKSIAALLLVPFLMAIAACDGNLPGLNDSDQADTDPTEQPTEQPVAEGSDPAPPTPDKPPIPLKDTETETLKIYWLTAENEEFALTASPLQLDEELSEADQLTQALERLMQGPANANVTTAIPEKTQLNKLTMKPDGVYVDLSKGFIEGGGSLSMQSRLGQIIYTTSSIKPTTPIWISVDGEPLTVLGGEGVELSQPMTRKEFSESFSL